MKASEAQSVVIDKALIQVAPLPVNIEFRAPVMYLMRLRSGARGQRAIEPRSFFTASADRLPKRSLRSLKRVKLVPGGLERRFANSLSAPRPA